MRRSKVEIYLHFVWGTLHRLPLVTEEIERDVYRCIGDQAAGLGCIVLAIGGISDHVHLLLRVPAKVSASELMKQVKGVSSAFGRDRLGGESLFGWQDGYGVFSVTRSHTDRVCAYIKNQKRHHADGTLWPEWEETDEEVV